LSKKKILIFGSCVTRDLFNFAESQQFQFVDIFARTSPASLMSKPVLPVPDLSSNDSAFQRRMVAWDMEKYFWDFIKKTDFDVIVFDFIDERYRQVYCGSGWVTRSNEIVKAKVVDKDDPGFGWPEEQYKTLFIEGLKSIKRALISLDREIVVVLNQAYWASHLDTGEQLADYTEPFIKRSNLQLVWVYEQFKAVFPDAAVMCYDDELLRTKKGHTWGEAPFHYRDSFYIDSIRQLSFIFDEALGKLRGEPLEKNVLPIAGAGKVKVSLSVDVEALPSRTREADKVSRLMWGNFSARQYGVPEIARIFKKFNAPATFFIEYFAAKVYGKASVFSLGQYIFEEGFRVEMHAHPELLGASGNVGGANSFAVEPFLQQFQLLKEVKELRDENLRTPGEVFRGGGLKYSADTVRAAARLGIKYLSNLYMSPYAKTDASRRVPHAFEWDEGPIELPVSACIDDIIQAGSDWKEKLSHLLYSEKGARHFFIHSWSLIRRDENGFHDQPDDGYRIRLEKIVEYLAENCELVDIVPQSVEQKIALSDLMESADGRPHVDFGAAHLEGRIRLASGHSVSSRARYRLHYEELGPRFDSLVPAYLAPVKVVPGQVGVSLDIDFQGIWRSLPMIVSGRRAFLQLKREPFPFDELSNETMLAAFKMMPGVNEINFSHLYGQEFLGSTFIASQPAGSTYVLALPATFEEYSENVINSDFLKLIERKQRALKRDYPGYSIRFFGAGLSGGDELQADCFGKMLDVVKHRMQQKSDDSNGTWVDPYTPEWIQKHLQVYQRNGYCAAIEVEGRFVAVSINLIWNGSLYYMAGGFSEELGGNYHLSKILFLGLIRRSIDSHIKRMQLGGGDFGFKERLGAKEIKLFSGKIVRPNAESKLELLRKVEETNSFLGHDLRTICLTAGVGTKHFLEGDVSKSLFDFDVPAAVKIPPGWRSASQVIVDALMLCFDRIGMIGHPSGLFDWNCGVGRNLLTAYEYFGCQVGGSAFDTELRDIAQANLEVGGISGPHLTFWDGTVPFDAKVLQAYDVFLAYNPAHLNVMKLIADAMATSSAFRARKIRFIYINPVCDEMFVGQGFVRETVLEKGVGDWRFTDRAIIYTYG
jgi:hypothetical protein